MKAIQYQAYGGPEVIEEVEKEQPVPSPAEVLVRIHSIGMNYADIARRQGTYVVPTPLPFFPGSEIAGTIEAVGGEITRLKPGDRVAALITDGGYAEFAAVHEQAIIPIPDSLDFDQAAAFPLQGLSAYHVLKTMGRLEQGETVLVHAAAGGVGGIAVQLAKRFGAGKIIATASTPEKLHYAKELGADVLINYTETGWEQKVLEATDGRGVDVAMEMAGGEIFSRTLDCLAPFGRLVVFGSASGEPSRLQAGRLMRANQSVIGFFLPQIMKRRDLMQQSLEELFAFLETGGLKLPIGETFPLAEAARAQSQMQERKTTGKLILRPDSSSSS